MKKKYTDKISYVVLREKTLYRGYAALFLVFVAFVVDYYVLWQYLFGLYGTSVISVWGIVIYTLVGIGILYFIYTFIRSLRGTLQKAENIIDILKTSKERYALAVSGSSEGLWDWDRRDDSLYVSPHWKRMLGFPEDAQIDSIFFWRDRIHPEDKIVVDRALTHHFEYQKSYYTAEYRMRTHGGVYKWIYDKGQAVRDDKGNAVRVAGSSRDITNVKNVEEVLKSRTEELEHAKVQVEHEMRNSRKFEQTVESATDAITIMTPPGNIIYANSAWEQLTGYQLDTIRGADFSFLIEDATPESVMGEMKQAMEAGESFVSEDLIGTRKDGSEFKMQMSLFPIEEKGRVIFYTALGENITHRKEVDKAKTEFVSLASHQLRTPLSAIRWYSEMLLSNSAGALSDKQHKYLQEIYDANKRMIELVGALLNVSRIDLGTFTMEPEWTQLPELIETAISELAPKIEKRNITINKQYGSVPDVHVDPKLTRIVFQNLLSNAVKYTPEGGSITITLEKQDDTIAFSVADTGYGIPQEQQDEIFTKLFRADNAQEIDPGGTGLGLYIVKAVVEKSGGSIWFESEEGKGTTFYGILPIDGAPRKAGTKEIGYYG